MEQKNVINGEEREISFKVLFANILKQWRKILVLMLTVCVLLVTYKAYKLGNSATTDANTEVVSTDEQKKAAEKELQSTTDSIKSLNDYINNSVYASINPYNEIETSTDISVVTSSNDNLETLLKDTNHSNQIAQAYSTFILKTIDYSELAKKMNINADYVKEIISAKIDYNSDTISLAVIGVDSKQTEEITKYIVDNVDDVEQQFRSQYGDHSIVVSKTVTNTKVDEKLLTTQTAANTTASYSNNAAMTQAVTRLNTLKTNLVTQKQTLDALLTSTTSTTNYSPKSFLKYGIVGLLGGLVLAIAFYAIKFAIEGKVTSENDVKNIYGFKVLSVFPINIAKRKLLKIDKVAYKQIDSAYGIGRDIAIEKAMMNITGYAGDKKVVLLIGSGLKQNLDELQGKLQALNKDIKFNISNNINADSNELAKLKDTDGVIVVAERNETRIDDLTKSVETIYNWKKEIIGSIVL